MPNYRRAQIPGGTYFFTVVTYKRRRILTRPESREVLRGVIDQVRQQYPFTIEAWVLLPEHIHCIWTLPEGDRDFSKRWGIIKAGLSKKTKDLFHREAWVSSSRLKHHEATLWQRRFWEHMIRNEEDLRRHIDYLHYNPVKHGWVERVKDWPYSTFHRYVKKGIYPENWGNNEEMSLGEDFGE